MTVSAGRIPCVFISSTCYDLSQIRHDIKDFLEQDLGYEAVLSEFESFPLDPSIGTVENCLRVVNERADLFVLVLGGRYGNITDNGKSVTNLEYIHARAKGIPIYIFVSKSILSILSVWKDNPDMDVSSVADSPRIFEFAEQVRSHDNVWVYPFEQAQDITKTLQTQFSYLFYDGLLHRKKLLSSGTGNAMKKIYGDALKIALEKPSAWEYLLFGELLQQGIDECYEIRLDYKNNINIGNKKVLKEIRDLVSWLENKITEILTLTEVLGKLFNEMLPIAFGPDGVEGSLDEIVYVADRTMSIYKTALDWALDFDAVSTEEEYEKIVSTARSISTNLIEDIENYAKLYNKKLAEALLLTADEENPIHIDLSWSLRSPIINEFIEEVTNLRRKLGI